MNIIKVGFTNSNKATRSCEKSPDLIMGILRSIKMNEKGKVINFDKISVKDLTPESDDLLEANVLIYEDAKEIFHKSFRSIFLGGDHSITCPIALAFKKIEPNPLLIVFDAHIDCQGGKELQNKNWLRKLVEEGFNPEKIVLISSRNFSFEEMEFVKENHITMTKMDILREGLEDVCDVVMERARKSTGFYVSIGLDSVDPAFAPATLYLEPGGLFSRDIIYFVKRLALLDNFKGGDIVDIDPKLDLNDMTLKLGARLVAEMI